MVWRVLGGLGVYVVGFASKRRRLAVSVLVLLCGGFRPSLEIWEHKVIQGARAKYRESDDSATIFGSNP